MNIEVIISTMNLQEEHHLLSKMNLINQKDIYITIINQISNDSGVEEKIEHINDKLKIIKTNSIGTANSRNLGLKYINEFSDIVCFTDDDVVYKDNLAEIISNIFVNNSNIDVALFNVISSSAERQIKLIKKIYTPNIFNLFRYGMYNLAIKVESLKKIDNLKFNEQFGGNAKYLCGEDSIFIYNLYKYSLNFEAFNINIADVFHNKSTWYDLEYSDFYFISKGALFYACDTNMYLLFIIYFALTHTFKSRKNIFKILNLMLKGKSLYKKENSLTK